KGKGKGKIKEKKDSETETVKITHPITLELVFHALWEYINNHQNEFGYYEITRIQETKICKTQAVAYFTAIIDRFLMRYNPDDKPAEIYKTKYKKRDLIAWMVYILEIDLIGEEKTEEVMRDREKFNSEICDGKRNLRELISSYKNKVDPKEFYLGKIHEE
ncbi:MAG: hypothetical protein II287_02335, partial [Bacteroidaceae bacterium]|nr:hypothetical protein [Bacteroidaceae bacterium]